MTSVEMRWRENLGDGVGGSVLQARFNETLMIRCHVSPFFHRHRGHLTRSFVVVLLAALHDLAVTLAYDTKS